MTCFVASAGGTVAGTLPGLMLRNEKRFASSEPSMACFCAAVTVFFAPVRLLVCSNVASIGKKLNGLKILLSRRY